jgi:hypothetical protein
MERLKCGASGALRSELAVARVRTTFYVRVRNLLVRPSAVGSSYRLSSDPEIVITLPSDRLDLGDSDDEERRRSLPTGAFPDDDPFPLVEGEQIITASMSSVPSESVVAVPVVRVRVTTEAPVDAASFERDVDSRNAAHQEANEVADSAIEAGRAAVTRFLAWTRVDAHQIWLGLIGQEEPELRGEIVVEDIDAQRRLTATPHRTDIALRVVEPESVLDESEIERIAGIARGSAPVPLGDSLLQDAAFYLQEATPPDPPRAVLIAAIACEVKVKDALRRTVSEAEPTALLELLLSNPRDFSVAAAAHFDKVMRATTGRSLRDEDRELFSAVERLFTLRNSLAHRGEEPSREDAQEAVRAAARAIRWLNQLVPS